MRKIEIHFSLPRTIVGYFVNWWTGDQYSHSWVVLDGVEYNPIPPRLKKLQSTEHGDLIIEMNVTDDEFDKTKEFCEELIGTFYDFLGILGWALKIKSWDDPKKMYCHEFCHEVFVRLNKFSKKYRLIHADHVIMELLLCGGIIIKGSYDSMEMVK